VFLALWAVLIYAPIAHWVWGGGWLAKLGALDFAGGTVVHVNAGVAAAVGALLLGQRRDYARQAILPHHIPFTLLGAALLWLGWFGFNAGSALAANESAALALTNTMLAPMATALVWMIVDVLRTGKVTAVGVATAIVVGLVAITPAAGFVAPLSASALGALAALPSYFALLWRARTRLDDSLDVFAVHGIGGLSGALLTGVLAQESWNGIADGLLFGNPMQVVIQALAVLAVAAYSALGTFVILRVIAAVTALRVPELVERLGLDASEHGEQAYTSGEGAILLLPTAWAAESNVSVEPKVKQVGGSA
ncbi:MAG: ammonium transporter, partial [Thermomicrobium sp.]